jgi:hypothetical protein
MASLDKWDDYTKAKEAMFFETDTADAPWTVIKSDCKKRARLNAMRYVLHKLPYTNKDLDTIGTVDPLLVGRAHVVYERGEHIAPLLARPLRSLVVAEMALACRLCTRPCNDAGALPLGRHQGNLLLQPAASAMRADRLAARSHQQFGGLVAVAAMEIE